MELNVRLVACFYLVGIPDASRGGAPGGIKYKYNYPLSLAYFCLKTGTHDVTLTSLITDI